MRDYTGFRSGHRATVRRWVRPLAIGVLGALLLAACDKLVDVNAPSRVIASGLEDPSKADLLVNSVGADFECAFATTCWPGLVETSSRLLPAGS